MADQAGDSLFGIADLAKSQREGVWVPAGGRRVAAATAATASATAIATAATAVAAGTPTPICTGTHSGGALPPTPESAFDSEGNYSTDSDSDGEEEEEEEEEEEAQAEESARSSSSAAIAQKIKRCKDLLKNFQADPHPFDKAALLCQISQCAETLGGWAPGGQRQQEQQQKQQQQKQKQQQQQQKLSPDKQIALSTQLLETAEALQLALEESAEIEKLKATIQNYEGELAKKKEEERTERKERSVVEELYAGIRRRQKRGDREPRFWPETELHGLSGPIRDMAMAENYWWLHEMHRRVSASSAAALRGRD